MIELVESCTFGKINGKTSPLFDIEYLFLRIRGKAVGETVELSVTCPESRAEISFNVKNRAWMCHLTLHTFSKKDIPHGTYIRW